MSYDFVYDLDMKLLDRYQFNGGTIENTNHNNEKN